MMRKFPYDHLNVGDKIMCRRVVARGMSEEDLVIGEWAEEPVTHVQRDKKGRISVIVVGGWVEFDPRYQWEGVGPYPCLMSEQYQLQIIEGAAQ